MADQEAVQNDVIEAAGALLWRETEDGRLVALIHRPRYDDWSLPKGKREVTESWRRAAIREVEEETGCQVRLGDFAGCTCYVVNGVPKIVLFWHALVEDVGTFPTNQETDRIVWLPVQQALDKLDYLNERTLLSNAIASRTGSPT